MVIKWTDLLVIHWWCEWGESSWSSKHGFNTARFWDHTCWSTRKYLKQIVTLVFFFEKLFFFASSEDEFCCCWWWWWSIDLFFLFRAKKLAIKRLKAPHYLQCNEKISNFHHQRHQIMFYIFGTYNLYKYVCVFISFAQSNKRIVAQSLYVQNFVPKFFSYLLTILPTFKALA